MNAPQSGDRADPIVVQAPAAPQRLIALFHGVGSDAPDLVPLGQWLAQAYPEAAVVSVPAPFVSDLGMGRQWFSVQGVTEDSRPARIEPALPLFRDTVQALQQRFTVTPAQTALVGFSQGAIMALESSRAALGLAGQIVSLSGRYAKLPDAAPADTKIAFIHGELDGVIPVGFAVQAAERLRSLGAAVSLDVLPNTQHQVTQATARLLVERLT